MSDCSFTQHDLNIHWSGYTIVWLLMLQGWCHMKPLPSRCVMCTLYNHAQVYSVTFSVLTYTPDARGFGRMTRVFYMLATVVTRGGTDTVIRVSTDSWPEKKILPPLLPGLGSKAFQPRVPSLYHWAIPIALPLSHPHSPKRTAFFQQVEQICF